MTNEQAMVILQVLTVGEQTVLSSLKVDEDKIHNIESNTREQSASGLWKMERMNWFTASSFQLIARRQRNHSASAQSLMHPEPFSSKYVAHRIKYEPIELQEYQQYTFNRKTPVAVLRTGLVVSKSCPVLGAWRELHLI